MRAWVACSDKDRGKFWADVETYPTAVPPVEVCRRAGAKPARGGRDRALRHAPERRRRPRTAPYIAIADMAWRPDRARGKGGGAIGMGLGPWSGGAGIARARRRHGTHPLTRRALSVARGFVIRRIAELAQDRRRRPDRRRAARAPARAMGSDLGAIHAAKPAVAAAIGKHTWTAVPPIGSRRRPRWRPTRCRPIIGTGANSRRSAW